MKNEVTQRGEGGVLYEPPEPLFPDMPPNRHRKILMRFAAFVMLICIVLVVWAVAVYAIGDENGSEERPTESVTEKEDAESDTSHTETESATESVTEEQEESESTENHDTGSIETESKPETEGENTPAAEIIESDLSLAERGDSYIVNYTDKAVDIAGLLDRGFADLTEKDSSAPVVMILHTHTSESYRNSKSEYIDGVIFVGDTLTRKLNAMGLTTLHCTVIHDGGEVNAYISARETIETMLKIYPSIKYIIDLHRMELEVDDIPVKTVSREGLAQIRLTVSADSSDWQENLSLALSLRQRLNEGDARICLPPVLSASRYNSDLAEHYLMIDIGATGNTVNEACMAAERLAGVIYNTIVTK